ncbi:hypothetical protein QBC43DRAFT_291708 [Cladorrhinum sp. PSN259]|nr:hypothetical protein QBC43DRAFT_291708 [Cladorrhinum sp. PSN259]
MASTAGRQSAKRKLPSAGPAQRTLVKKFAQDIEGNATFNPADELATYSGFVYTGEIVELEPLVPSLAKEIYIGKIKNGITRVVLPSPSQSPISRPFIPWKLLMYRGLANRQGHGEDDGKRFVYLSKQRGESPTCGDCFVLFNTIKARVQGDGSALQRDIEDSNNRQPLQFSVWNESGEKDTGLESQLAAALNPIGRASVDSHFRFWTELVSRSTGAMKTGNIMEARYWNESVQDDNVLSTGIRIAFNDDIYATMRRGRQDPNLDNDTIYAKLLVVVQAVAASASLKVRLNITRENICFFREIQDNTTGWQLLGQHPGGLYRIYVNEEAASQLSNRERHNPLIRTTRAYPSEDAARDVNESMNQTKDSRRKAGRTMTVVTKNSILAARSQERGISQNHVMHSEGGMSANVVAISLGWTADSNTMGDTTEGMAEWLHRSAWSYGGLLNEYGAAVGARAAQNVQNLVFGSHETNTVMMR